MKSSEVDRARGSFRLSALKEKVLYLETALSDAKKDKERLQKTADKFEASKAALTRKDAVIKVECTEMIFPVLSSIIVHRLCIVQCDSILETLSHSYWMAKEGT